MWVLGDTSCLQLGVRGELGSTGQESTCHCTWNGASAPFAVSLRVGLRLMRVWACACACVHACVRCWHALVVVADFS